MKRLTRRETEDIVPMNVYTLWVCDASDTWVGCSGKTRKTKRRLRYDFVSHKSPGYYFCIEIMAKTLKIRYPMMNIMTKVLPPSFFTDHESTTMPKDTNANGSVLYDT